MENISTLKEDKQLPKNLAAWVQSFTLSQLAGALLCFLFSRASFFEVLRPFSLAFYAAAPLTGLAKVLSLIAILTGNLCFSGFYEAVRQLGTLLIFEAVLYYCETISNKNINALQRSLLMGFIAFVTGILRGLMQGLHLYDVITALLMASFVFSVAVLLGPVAEEFQCRKTSKVKPDMRTLFSKILLICVMVISLENVSFFNMEASDVIAGLSILVFARRKGSASGACMGAFIGFVLAIYRIPGSLELPGLLSLAGAAAGLPFKSKTVSVSLWTLVVFFFTGLSILEGSMISQYYSSLASGLIFLVLPNKWIDALSNVLAGQILPRKAVEDAMIRRTSHEAADKLYVLGKALSRVSRNMTEYTEEEALDERTMAESVIEIVADRVCNRCTMCERCWGSHLMKTYKLVEKAVSDLKTDESGMLEVPNWFKNTCARNEKFFESLGIAYSLYKAEKVWRMQLLETRGLIAKQAGVIAFSVMRMARTMVEGGSRDDEMELDFLREAVGLGLPVADIRLRSKPERSFDIVCHNTIRLDMDQLDRMVKEKMGKQVVRIGEARRDLLGYSVMRYIHQPRFKTVTGVARLSRENTSVSGDSFTFFITGNGLHISAISDGTGSGKKAERYSRTAIQMLEYLIEDGVEIQLAIKLMKIYLQIRGESEPLATFDVLAVNLVSGESLFYKQGAPASFIRKKSGIFVIASKEKSGEDEQEETGAITEFLDDGDFIIMVSDGVSQAFSEDDESSLFKYLAKQTTLNPQQVADEILTEAQVRSSGYRDDMTVMVTRLW